MSSRIPISLIDAEDVVLKEAEKKHCFFVGKADQPTNAVFETAYEITHAQWPKNIFASFEIGSRTFTNLSFSKGKTISKAKGAYSLKKHPDGTMYLFMCSEYTPHDSYEKMYACKFERVVYRENGELVVIQAKHGSVLPKINVFIGLRESVPYLDSLLDILDNSASSQTSRLKMLMRCVAQKYRLSNEAAEQMENFVIYTCLDAANISASFGIFKNKKKSLSFELLKAIADYICGTCSPEWYQTAPRKRYDRLADLIDYIRHLKGDKYVEWSAEERAYCHSIRKWIDSAVFADVYAVSLVLLRFMAENDIADVYSFKAAAVSPGVFGSTLMADTVDRFSAGQLDGEAKEVFFSLIGKNADNVKARMERALYHYHAGSNYLFQTTQALTLQSGMTDTKREAKVVDDAVETAVLSTAAKAALLARDDAGDAMWKVANSEKEIIAAMCQTISETYGICIIQRENDNAVSKITKALIESVRQFLREEVEKLNRAQKPYAELAHDFVPEYHFVLVYTTAFLMLLLTTQALMHPMLYSEIVHLSAEEISRSEFLLQRQALKTIMLEAKYRYGAMCGAQLLEIMAQNEI